MIITAMDDYLNKQPTFYLQYSTDALSPENKNETFTILAYSNDKQIMYYM